MRIPSFNSTSAKSMCAALSLSALSIFVLAAESVAETAEIGPFEERVTVPAKDRDGNPYKKCETDVTIPVNLPRIPYQTNQDALKTAACKAKETAELKDCTLVPDSFSFEPQGRAKCTLHCYGDEPSARQPDLSCLVKFKCKCTKVDKNNSSGGGVVIEHGTSSTDAADDELLLNLLLNDFVAP